MVCDILGEDKPQHEPDEAGENVPYSVKGCLEPRMEPGHTDVKNGRPRGAQRANQLTGHIQDWNGQMAQTLSTCYPRLGTAAEH